MEFETLSGGLSSDDSSGDSTSDSDENEVGGTQRHGRTPETNKESTSARKSIGMPALVKIVVMSCSSLVSSCCIFLRFGQRIRCYQLS